MKKIPTVFVIDREAGLAIDEVNAGAEWVLLGEGVASVKYDGTACFSQNGILYKRFDRKLTKKARAKMRRDADFVPCIADFKPLPEGSIALEDSWDAVTYHWPFWVPVNFEDPGNAAFLDAMQYLPETLVDGSYELVGPKIQGNPYALTRHAFLRHGQDVVPVVDRSFSGIKAVLTSLDEEGVVFEHPDGRMAKIRRKDFFEFKELSGGRKINWHSDNLVL